MPSDRPVLACIAALSLLALGCAGRHHTGDAVLDAAMQAELSPTGGYTGRFNNDDQGHADFCVTLRSPAAALRYVDGTPSGFTLTADILVPEPGNGVWCPERGMARLDAREIVIAADGRKMLFHRGGWGFAGNDPASAVHFGHVLVSDIDTVGYRYVRSTPAERRAGAARGRWVAASTEPWPGTGQQAGNGSPCNALSPEPDTVSVQSIPGDMKYLNSARTSAIPYAIYGSPAVDLGPRADRARGIEYTMLTWSWINVRGGGVARALIRDGDTFYRCTDVPPIRLAAVADARTRTRTGWVQAVYGAIRTGDRHWLYGWIVSAHRHGGDAIVSHLISG